MARRLPVPAERAPIVESLQDLGEVVRNARARAQLRVDDAAVISGVSSDMLSRLERGRPVTSDRLLAVLSSLGLAVLIVEHVQVGRIEKLIAAHDAENH